MADGCFNTVFWRYDVVGSAPYLFEFVSDDMIQLLQVAPTKKTQRD